LAGSSILIRIAIINIKVLFLIIIYNILFLEISVNNKKEKKTLSNKILDWIEKSGNVLPDPAILFFAGLVIVWLLSAVFSGIQFSEIDPRTGENLKVVNLLGGEKISDFFANMVKTFIYFAPLGIVLVAILGVGVAEQS
jgi:aminobenzoyl-glutamate transport protein